MCRTRFVHYSEHDVRVWMATLPFSILGKDDYTAHSIALAHDADPNHQNDCTSRPLGDSVQDEEMYAHAGLHRIIWHNGKTPWGDSGVTETEPRDFPFLATSFSSYENRCLIHSCCLCKETVIYCDNYKKEGCCHPEPGVDDDKIWPDCVAQGYAWIPDRVEIKGFMEHEYHYLGTLATSGRSKQHRQEDQRWFYMSSTGQRSVDFEEYPLEPGLPFPLDLVYRSDLEDIDPTSWEDDHANAEVKAEPINKDHIGEVARRMRFYDDPDVEKQPHIQAARYGHDLWRRKMLLQEMLMIDMMADVGVFDADGNRDNTWLDEKVARLKNMIKEIIKSWQCYLYWLRLALIKIGKLPAPGETLVSEEHGFVVSGDELDEWAFGRGKSINDLINAMGAGQKYEQYWDTCLYVVAQAWVALRDGDHDWLSYMFRELKRQDNEPIHPHPGYDSIEALRANPCFNGRFPPEEKKVLEHHIETFES